MPELARDACLLSRRVLNDESALPELVGDVLALSEDTLWAVAINHGGAALLISLLVGYDHQPMVYLAGLAVHQASAAYWGQGETDARRRGHLRHRRPGPHLAVPAS
ncbi:IS110 family transposase [Streptomyces avermitilis]